jgi:hypothetical protein
MHGGRGGSGGALHMDVPRQAGSDSEEPSRKRLDGVELDDVTSNRRRGGRRVSLRGDASPSAAPL